MPHVENSMPLSFRYDELEASLKLSSNSRFKVGRVCFKAVVRAVISLALLIFTVCALPVCGKFENVKFSAFNLVRSLELLSGGILFRLSREKGAYLIMDANAHIAMYDSVMKQKRRSRS